MPILSTRRLLLDLYILWRELEIMPGLFYLSRLALRLAVAEVMIVTWN